MKHKLDGTVRSMVVHEDMVRLLAEAGYVRSLTSIQNKIKNLKRRFHQTLPKDKKSGEGQETCVNYKQLENLIRRAANKCPCINRAGRGESWDGEQGGGGWGTSRMTVPGLYRIWRRLKMIYFKSSNGGGINFDQRSRTPELTLLDIHQSMTRSSAILNAKLDSLTREFAVITNKQIP